MDYVFILADYIRRNRERLYQNFAGVFPTFEAFSAVMDETTANYECMVLNLSACSPNINDIVFFYKSTPNLQFKMGSKEYWDFALSNTAVKYNSDDEDETSRLIKQKKSKYKVKKQERPDHINPINRLIEDQVEEDDALYMGKTTHDYARDFQSLLAPEMKSRLKQRNKQKRKKRKK